MPDFLSRLADRAQTSSVEASLRPASVPRFATLRASSAGGVLAGEVPAGDVAAGDVAAGDVPAGEVPFGQMSGGTGAAQDQPRQPAESLPRDPHASRQRAFEQRLDEMFSSPAFAGLASRPVQRDLPRRLSTHETRRPADGMPDQGQLDQHQSEQGQAKPEPPARPVASRHTVSGSSSTDGSSGTRQADRVAASPDGTVQPRSSGLAAERHDQDAADTPVAASPRSGLQPVRPRPAAPSSTRGSGPTSEAGDRAPSARAASNLATGNRLGREPVVEERTVRVRIGRVEVRNVTPAPAPAAGASAPRATSPDKRPPPPSLDDYLRRRREGR